MREEDRFVICASQSSHRQGRGEREGTEPCELSLSLSSEAEQRRGRRRGRGRAVASRKCFPADLLVGWGNLAPPLPRFLFFSLPSCAPKIRFASCSRNLRCCFLSLPDGNTTSFLKNIFFYEVFVELSATVLFLKKILMDPERCRVLVT
jgi:hypothetical protein